jgi:hypothetical protein
MHLILQKMFWHKAISFYILCYCSVFYKLSTGQGFNSLLHKTIDANVTCGDPAEIYFRTQEGVLHPRLRTPLVCDAADAEDSHPPDYMVDGDLATFWQSKASIDRADIRIDLNQVGRFQRKLYAGWCIIVFLKDPVKIISY